MKILTKIIGGFAFIVWALAGINVFVPLHDESLKISWMMGFYFGLLFITMMTWASTKILFIFCKISPQLKAHVEAHWGNPDYLKEDTEATT